MFGVVSTWQRGEGLTFFDQLVEIIQIPCVGEMEESTTSSLSFPETGVSTVCGEALRECDRLLLIECTFTESEAALIVAPDLKVNRVDSSQPGS